MASIHAPAGEPRRSGPFYTQLYFQVLAAIFLGGLIGFLFPLNTFGVVDQTPLYDAQTNAMWLGISGNTQVAYFDLAGLHPRTLELDWPVLQLLHVGGKTPRIVAVHPGADGDVTLIDAKSPSTDSAQGLRGLLISELLEEGK